MIKSETAVARYRRSEKKMGKRNKTGGEEMMMMRRQVCSSAFTTAAGPARLAGIWRAHFPDLLAVTDRFVRR